jgi:hypothetical protein
MTQVGDWRDLPRYRSIKVTTKTGASDIFQRWHFTSDSALIGFAWNSHPIQADEVRPRWDIHRIPCDSIAAIYSIDRRPSTTAEVAIMIGGATVCAAFLWYLVRAVSFMPSGKWN